MENYSLVPSWIYRTFGAVGVNASWAAVVSGLLFPAKPGPLHYCLGQDEVQVRTRPLSGF
ncbi:uncharacterized protein EURHEDRAFT_416613, partial [Aspergillus ruber CBS 135680]